MTASSASPAPAGSGASATGAVASPEPADGAAPHRVIHAGSPPHGAGRPTAGILSYAAPKARIPLFSADAWSPLKVDLFRSLYIATSIAQIGTWVREAGGPWLMKLLVGHAPNAPDMVAKVLVFSNLPICLFSILAGALADVLDRRRLLIVTQIWMMVVSAILGIMTVAGHITPFQLLALTFLVGTGTAAAGPALQALLPELVPRKDLALAINLNSVALNVARALGPAMFIVVVAIVPGMVGTGISFFVTAASFIWAIWVLLRWKRPPQIAGLAGERVWGAIRAGYQYTIHSAANRAILLRVFAFIVPAVVMWSQVPIIATRQFNQPQEVAEKISAALFAFIGLGAVLGVVLMPGLHGRFKIDPVVNVCTACFAAGLIGLSFVHQFWLAVPIMIFLGINWVIIPTNFNTATQKSVPLWVKGRAISFYLTVLFGSFAVAGSIWGKVTGATSIATSLQIGGLSMAALLVLAKWFPLTLNEGLDLNAAFAGPPPRPVLPDIVPPPDLAGGPQPLTPSATPPGLDDKANPTLANNPVQVSLHYDVHPTRVEEFLGLMRKIEKVRLRNGATHWRLVPAGAGAASTVGADATSAGDGAPSTRAGAPSSVIIVPSSTVGSTAATLPADPLPATGAASQVVRYTEIIRYRSTTEHSRQPARMTRHDFDLHTRARALHAGDPNQIGQSEILTGDAADPYAGIKTWLAIKLAEMFDRIFDQTAATFDRFADLHDRERQARVPRYREIRIRLPE